METAGIMEKRLFLRQFLAENNAAPIPHLPHSPNLALLACVFLFPKVMTIMKGERFADIDQVQDNLPEAIKSSLVEGSRNSLLGWKKNNWTSMSRHVGSALMETRRLNSNLYYVRLKQHFPVILGTPSCGVRGHVAWKN